MSPRVLLLLVSIGILIVNLFTVRFRERKAASFENRLRAVAENGGETLTVEGISQALEIPIYDAKILTRKFVSKGKMDVQGIEGEEVYVFKS
ncbi:MAG TPA: hypothetical protein ENH13_01815 [Euryarchaeota archaeon]|nr:hypothetical protein BMS3Bbin16_00103 [archaeon BMS3Bbin16]HDH27851.1 hypothetical protein [Euryarchaeota archaeon]